MREKNNREESEPKLHINFRSSLSRCQSGRVNKKNTEGKGDPAGVVGHPEKAYWLLGGKDLCIKIYATPSGRHHTQSPDYSIPLPTWLTLVMLSEVCERAVRKQK